MIGGTVPAAAAADALADPTRSLRRAGTCGPGAGCGPRSRRDLIAWIDLHDECSTRPRYSSTAAALRRAAPARRSNGRQRAAGIDARSASSSGSVSESTGSRSEARLDARQRAGLRARSEHQCRREGVRNRPFRMQGLGIFRVVGDQQERLLIDRDLGERLQQPGAKARVECAQHGRCALGAGGDAPVAGRRVVHRIGKARRRDLAALQSPALGRSRGNCVRLPPEDENTLASRAGATAARVVASTATASASFTTRPVRRRSAADSSVGIGRTVGTLS